MEKTTDQNYWAEYYKSGKAPEDPSAFARHVKEKYLKDGMILIELGCGNARDSKYFASKGMNVLAIDQVVPEIEELAEELSNVSNLEFEVADFTYLPPEDGKFDLIYSRFTVHSVDKAGQDRVLTWSNNSLSPVGYLCIETRGKKNELYMRGTPVDGEEDAYIFNDHYRRFVDFESIKDEIIKAGFKIIEADEQDGYAPYDDTDYQFIRIIAQKL